MRESAQQLSGMANHLAPEAFLIFKTLLDSHVSSLKCKRVRRVWYKEAQVKKNIIPIYNKSFQNRRFTERFSKMR